MWAKKEDRKFYINADRITEHVAEGYDIYDDDMNLLDNPKELAVDTLEVKGGWMPNE